MSKRKQGPINKKVDFLPNRLNKYSIRKFTVGTASILVGASLVFGVSEEVQAAENTNDSTTESNESTQKSTVDTTEVTTTQEERPSTKETTTSEQSVSTEEASTQNNTTQATTEQPSTEEKATTEQPSTEETTTKPADSTQSESSSNEDKESNKNLTDDNKTTNDSVTSDTKAIASKMNKPTVSDDSSVTDKKAYTDDIVSNLNVDTDNKEAITNAVSNDIDLENASQDEINNAIVAEALKTDFTNPDYGVNTPIALASTLNTTSSTSPTRSFSPYMSLMTYAAETPTSGTNVNNKITITDASMTVKKRTSHADDYIVPTNEEQFNIKANYTLDDSITEGDTFTIKYGDYIRPGALELPATNTQLRSNKGEIVANGVYDQSTNTTTYTFTNYVDQYQNVKGSFSLIATPKRETANVDGQSYPMSVKIAGQEIDGKPYKVEYGNHKNQLTNAAVAYVDNTKNEHVEVAYLNQNNLNPRPAHYFSTVKNGQFGEVKVYKVLDNSAFVDSFNPNLNSSSVKEVTSSFTPDVNNDKTRVDIKFADKMHKGQKYIVVQSVKPSGTGNVYTEYWVTRDGTTNGYAQYNHGSKSTTVSYLNGSSTASGDNPMYSLGDRVWNDVNHNGIQDDNDQGIQGVYVTLKDSNNRELQRVTTDATGHYQFDNLQNGTYTVEFSIPKDRNGKDYTLSPANNTNDDTVDSDGELDSARNIVTATGMINNSDNMTVDTGFYLEQPTYKLGDYVWQDTNDNGIQDDGDTGISGVTVTLTNNETNETTTTTTDATGKYEFNDLSNGKYTVTFTTPENMVDAKTGTTTSDKDSNPSTSTVVINNADDMTIDKGYVPTYNLGDRVWEDTDKNGIQDAGEKGFANVGVELRDSNNKVIDTATTDSNGNYLFTNVKNGTYTVVFQTPDGYTATLANVGNDDAIDSNGTTTIATINGADNLTVDSGFYKDTPVPTPNKYNVGDRVWNDVNRNGIQDDGESGIGGVNVILKKDGRTIGNTVTDNQGNYGFYDLDEGEYTIEFIDPDGYTETTSNAPGSTTENDSNGPVVRIELHNDDNSIDYGLYKDTQSGYEITVEDVSYKNVVRENKELPKNSIQLVQQGEDGRDRVFYKELGYNPDLIGIDDSKLLEEDGYYWQEVRRDNLYSPKDAIIEYNLDNNEGVTNITYNPTTNQFKVEYSDREPEYIDGPNPKDGKDGQSVTT
ncbi:SdrD B-like domain-containing protein, partial [Staphylococcus sp. HMSC072E01]